MSQAKRFFCLLFVFFLFCAKTPTIFEKERIAFSEKKAFDRSYAHSKSINYIT